MSDGKSPLNRQLPGLRSRPQKNLLSITFPTCPSDGLANSLHKNGQTDKMARQAERSPNLTDLFNATIWEELTDNI